MNVYFISKIISEGEKPELKQKKTEERYAALQIVPNIEKLGTAKVCYVLFSYYLIVE